ncbi:uncharacterized protein LOC104583904 [Brachypodium distachyon]|uniref:Uncharacterized protein n=1 Tax=Brachypodium distachyon TaxID=15368 RepID=I1HW76_BRADI|nr:uncharacterized protein LOC104583904 [Brachypodium distachyon]KQJ92841.1 hypothetical protein BRADI_3g01037v3 [Brachypodium distachyon]|eukprot:XP_010236220.2 uncharacterized protein LOC104583904 [Brachypodium distachyon]
MGEETRRRRRSISPAALPDDDDLLGEILLRLPATPSSLPRASLVCKRWRRLATDAGFLRRFRVRHRKDAPLLGVFFEQRVAGMGRRKDLPFVPVLDAPDRIPPARFSLRLDDDDLDGGAAGSWSVLGCRHGRVLVINRARLELLVFDPVAGDRRRVGIAPPPFVGKAFHANAAVLCDEDDHGGHGRSGSAFKVVFVATSDKGGEKALARVYSSETGQWGDPVSAAEPCVGHVGRRPGTLAGNALYWWLNASADDNGILQFDLGTQRLAVIKRPPFTGIHKGCSRIIRAEDGTGVGFAVLSYPSFQTWDRKVDCLGVASWQLRKTVNMHKVLGLPSMIEAGMARIVGYDEDAGVILVSVCTRVYSRVFVVPLESMQSRKLPGSFSENAYHPFTSFYTGTVVKSAPATEHLTEQPLSH